MNDTKITKERIQNHFAYSWWKYVLLAVFAVFGWNMVYTMTKYQAPPDRRLGIYFVTHPIDSGMLDQIQNAVLEDFPGLEEVRCHSVVFSEEDDYYGSIQLSTYIGAGEGDVYIMSRRQFSRYAPGGAFLALDDAVKTVAIDAQGLNVESGYARNEDTGERELYAIPANALYGMLDYGIDNRDLMICVMRYSKNMDTAIQCANWFVQTMQAPKPEWLAEVEPEQNMGELIEDYPSY